MVKGSAHWRSMRDAMASLVAQRTGGIGNYDLKLRFNAGPHGRDPETPGAGQRPVGKPVAGSRPRRPVCLRATHRATNRGAHPTHPGRRSAARQHTRYFESDRALRGSRLQAERDGDEPPSGTRVAEHRSAGALARHGERGGGRRAPADKTAAAPRRHGAGRLEREPGGQGGEC